MERMAPTPLAGHRWQNGPIDRSRPPSHKVTCLSGVTTASHTPWTNRSSRVSRRTFNLSHMSEYEER
jgi:hypothetical protein